jgi:hypothetical protein
MPKPPITKEDVKAIDQAYNEKRTAEDAMLKAFRDRAPTSEIDNAIRRFNKARDDYYALTSKFFDNYPK